MTKAIDAVIVRRLIRARRAQVFDAFSRAEALTLWFTPGSDISVEVLTFDFTPQGDFRFRYTMADGTRPIVGGTYETISPPDELAFSWIWEPPDRHADIWTRVLVQFHEKGDATEVLITHDHLPSVEAGSRFVAGWEGTLASLAMHLS